jgi:hypothetical protein
LQKYSPFSSRTARDFGGRYLHGQVKAAPIGTASSRFSTRTIQAISRVHSIVPREACLASRALHVLPDNRHEAGAD